MQNWLKNVLVAGFLAALPILAAKPAEAGETTASAPAAPMPSHAHGVHGMLLFGEPGRVFASHLPLYRHPHDWQVVLELEPIGQTAQVLTNELLADNHLLTLEPERFDLLRLRPGAAEPLRQFRAGLYLNHFERGGAKLDEFDWQVKRVWVFEKIDVGQEVELGHRYFRVGSDGSGVPAKLWLVHKIERVPDTDQIVEASLGTTVIPELFQSPDLLSSRRPDLPCNTTSYWRLNVLWQDSDDLQ